MRGESATLRINEGVRLRISRRQAWGGSVRKEKNKGGGRGYIYPLSQWLSGQVVGGRTITGKVLEGGAVEIGDREKQSQIRVT